MSGERFQGHWSSGSIFCSLCVHPFLTIRLDTVTRLFSVQVFYYLRVSLSLETILKWLSKNIIRVMVRVSKV